jgi:hypothetical protein
MVRLVLAAGLAGLLVAAFTARASEPINRDVKDWDLACDNTGACEAMVGPDVYGLGPSDWPRLKVRRDPGPDGRLIVSLTYGEGFPDPSGLRLDGRALGDFAWEKRPNGRAITVSDDEARRFLDLIRNRSKLAVTPDAKADPLSLTGLTAALLAMDEAQGRVGGVTALVRRGGLPASVVPPADVKPLLRARPAKRPLERPDAFIAAVRNSGEALLSAHACEPGMAEEDKAYALNDKDALIILGCQGKNDLMLVLRAPRAAPSQARELVLPGLHGPTPGIFKPGEYYMEDGWDADAATLSECAGKIGLADCTGTTRWVFDGEQFRLSELTVWAGALGVTTIYSTRVEVVR